MPQPISILIVEDHEILAQGLRAMLDGLEFKVLAVVRDGLDVVTFAQRHHPTVILLDLSLPGQNGTGLLTELHALVPESVVLILTMHSDPVLAEALLKRGASGFVTKDANIDVLREAIREVARGNKFLCPSVARQEAVRRGAMPELRLTPRQQAILQMIGQGMETDAIAKVLGVSVHTIHFHRRNIHATLGLATELELVRYATLKSLGDGHAE